MARVQLVIPDDDRIRFLHQARREGKSLSAWLRLAARERLERQSRDRRLGSCAELEEFFAECDANEGSDTEPDWSQHRAVIDQSRTRGGTNA